MDDSSAIFLPEILLASASALSRAPLQAGQILRVKMRSYSARTWGCSVSGSLLPSERLSLGTTPS